MIGRTLSHYEIIHELGAGGMGIVYKAHDSHLDRFVALKILSSATVADPERKRRFVQEAKAASALNHPNIVTVYDIDCADGIDYIAMEYVEGRPLEQVIGRNGLPLAQVLKYAIQMTDALMRAHQKGIVHRDFKPANVVVRSDGVIKILDFGLAKLTEPPGFAEFAATRTLQSAVKTREGRIVGTAAYMSPEQAEGRDVDRRSDIFSFGAVLYEMITGRRAFQADSALATLALILQQEPRPAAGLPPDLERLVGRCLRKDRDRRIQHIDEAKVILQELEEESGSAPGRAPGRAAQRERIRRLARVIALLAICGLTGAGIWLALFRSAATIDRPMTVLPLTTLPGSELDPALSPDGKQVAFVWDHGTGESYDLYVQLVGTESPLRITSNPEREYGPAWSPDGRHLAFYRRAGSVSEIISTPALGGPERKLGRSSASWLPDVVYGANHTLSWSPDGKVLAIVDKPAPLKPDSIFLLSTDTGEKRQLTSPPDGYFGDTCPEFSPDGRTVAFLRTPGGATGDIYVTPTESTGTQSKPKRVTFDEQLIRGFSWMSDGVSLVFSSNRKGPPALWRISAPSATRGGLSVPRHEAARLAINEGGALHPTISRPAGGAAARLVYMRYFIDTDIWRIPGGGIPGTSAGNASDQPMRLIASTRWDSSPQYSPEGNRIVFASSRSGAQEIWVSDAEGQNNLQLTSLGHVSTGSPRWSSDGQWVAFDSLEGEYRHIYVVGAGGGSPRRLTNEKAQDSRPAWSNDGQWIYFASNRTGMWQIWKMPASGGVAVPITREGGREAFESHDGAFLYFAKFADGEGIWRVPVKGGEEIKILDHGGFGGFAVAPEGLYILEPGRAAGPAVEFWAYGADSPRQVTVLDRGLASKLVSSGPHLAISPDGRWILCPAITRNESDLMLVENVH